MNIDTLKQLQDRIRNSSGADRELDAEIACALFGGTADVAAPAIDPEYRRRRIGSAYFDVPAFTASLDACVGLLEATLPGHRWWKDQNNHFWVTRKHPRGFWLDIAEGKPLATDCLTFLDAILSAKISELEAKGSVG